MIFVCEPTCKSFSHEKFNSAFLRSLKLAYPNEKIIFYAHRTHIKSVKDIIKNDQLQVLDLEYREIFYTSSQSLTGCLIYFYQIVRIYKQAMVHGNKKVFFLSFDSIILYLIKYLKKKSSFSELKATLVLHGIFESIAEPGTSNIVLKNSLPIRTRKEKFKNLGLIKITKIILTKVLSTLSPWQKFSKGRFKFKEVLEWNHSPDFRYISLAPHAVPTVKKYLDIEKLNITSIVLPMSFRKASLPPKNDYIKFSIYGYGNAETLYNILLELDARKIETKYEIRIIGMDDRGTKGFSNVTTPSNGRPLSRIEMEELSDDIDMFLILYDQRRYKITCSGSILEALSNMKPIIHLSNDCINYFNNPSLPIGEKCDSIHQFVDQLQDYIENYSAKQEKLRQYRQNLLALREKCSIEAYVGDVKKSFDWEEASF